MIMSKKENTALNAMRTKYLKNEVFMDQLKSLDFIQALKFV